jgi:hypothetical protein
MERAGTSHFEIRAACVETEPGHYYEGEDASYDGAAVRPTIGGIASGTGAGGKAIPITGVGPKGEITYGKLVNNDAVTEKPVPYNLRPISDHYTQGV